MTDAPPKFAWSMVEPILEEALSRAPEARRAWLEDACAGEPGLADEIWKLLLAATEEDEFLESPWSDADAGSPEEHGGGSIGRYLLLERIGAGGMGSVWLGERADGHYRQRVAIKVVKRGMDTDAVIRRFRLERQLLADLEHPFIARLLDGGATKSGLPFLVMEHVEGTPILRWCDSRQLGLRPRLELFVKVCEAVAFAHGRGIVHCDLKPGNVLVDANGEPRLLDFGIAKVLTPDDDGSIERTRTGDRFLSPRYASPEQIRGESIDRTTDVYALGIVLYELLTGVHPHGQITITWRAFEDEVLERQPIPPSKAVLVSPPPAPPEGRTLRSRALRGDVDTIVLTALRKEPERRYTDAGALGADLGRFLAGLPVRARRDTWVYRSGKFLVRHRILTVTTLAFIGMLCSALAVTWTLYGASERAGEEARWNAYTRGLVAAEAALRDGSAREARASLASVPEDRRGWIWQHLDSRTDRSLRSLPVEAAGPLALDPTRGRVALLVGSRIDVLHTETLAPVWTRDVPEDWRRCTSLSLSPNGRWLVATFSSLRRARAFDLDGGLATDLPSARPDEETADRLVRFHPLDGRLFVVSGAVLRVLDPELKSEVARQEPHRSPITALDVSPDGSRLATATFGEALAAIRDADTLEELHRLEGHRMGLYSIDFSPSGARVATGSLDGSLRVWDADSGDLVHAADLGSGNVVARFLASDDEILVSTKVGTMFVWKAGSLAPGPPWLGHVGQAYMEVDPARERVYSLDDASFREWSFDTRDIRVLPAGEWCDSVTFDPTGGRLWNVGPDGSIRRWIYPAGLELEALGKTGSTWVGLDLDPRGGALVAIDSFGRVERWDLAHETPVAECPAAVDTGRHCEIRYDPTGERLLRVAGSDWIEVLDSSTCEVRRRIDLPGENLYDARWLPDGSRIVAVTGHGRLIVFRPAEGVLEAELEPVGVWPAEPSPGSCVAVHPDGSSVVTGHADGTLVRWSLAGSGPVSSKREEDESIVALAFHPGGSLLAVGGRHAVHLWDLGRLEPVATLHGHVMAVFSLAFSPDGRTLASASHDGTIRLWETE